MKIGIDAKWLFSQNISGRVFIQNILSELIPNYPGIEWYIFLDAKDKNRDLPFPGKKVKVFYVWAGMNMLSNLFVIPRYAKKLELDAVLFQTFSPHKKYFKSIVFIHDVLHARYPQYFTWKERLYFKPEKLTLPRAHRVITTTEYVRGELQKFGYANKEQPVDLAPLGISDIFKSRAFHKEDSLQKIKQKYSLPDSYLLFVGRINARKNIGGLFEAIRLVNDKNIQVVIVGEKDWKAPQLKKFTDDPELRLRIIFTGAVSDEELSAIYALATVFCFPSFAEGMGLPPIEAMASGIPVVVSDTSSMPGVCGAAALYANPHDPAQIASRINELLENKTLYQQKVQEGLAWSKQYTWQNAAAAIMRSIFAALKSD